MPSVIPASPAMTTVSASAVAAAAASSGKPDEEFPDFGPISSALPLTPAGHADAADFAVEGAAAVAAGKPVVAPPVVLLHGPAT